MQKQFFDVPLHITGYGFDKKGRGFPTRIELGGKTFRVATPNKDGLVSYSCGGAYYWLERRGRTWCRL